MATLDNIAKNLIWENPFDGYLLLNLNKIESTKVPTVGVRFNGLNIELTVNPEFWNSLSDDHQKGLLIHELRHIAYFHITDYEHLHDKEIANIAMDVYINQEIENKYLPEGGAVLDKFKHLGLVEGESTNDYYKKLKQAYDQNQDPAFNQAVDALKEQNQGNSSDPNSQSTYNGKNGKVDLQNHQWGKDGNGNAVSQQVKDAVSKSLEHILDNVVEDLKKKGIGNMPGNISEVLSKKKVLEKPKFDWQGYTRRFVGNSTRHKTIKTLRKQSKRFEDQPGLKSLEFSHILFAIDNSASVSTEELLEMQNELCHLYKIGHDITIIQADTEINGIFTFNPKEDLKITGRGGTSFDPVIDYYSENLKKFSCLIYFTDGEASTPKRSPKNVLWVHSSKCHAINNDLVGRKIKLEK